MKLIKRTSIAYLFLSGIAFLISVAMLYIILTVAINDWLDEKLLHAKNEVVGKLKFNYPLTTLKSKTLGKVKNLNYPKDTITYKDTAVFVPSTKEFDVFRQLTAYETIRDKQYKIIARSSLVNDQGFTSAIILYIIVIFSLLLTGLWILNTLIAKRIWNPFYTNLTVLKNFSIQNQNTLKLKPSRITEFEELNSSITNLTNRVQSDFNNLKEFTENASHEMQTPLAIMRSKIEILLQSSNLTKIQTKELHAIYQAGNRLSKLNKALTLLSKVDNQQYEINETINLKNALEERLEFYEDFIENKNLTINKNIHDKTIVFNEALIKILISNLLSNAIRHNYQNGIINILCNEKEMVFSNTGKPLKQNPKSLFNRFKKESSSAKSIGLGLAIVKRICDINKYNISYLYQNELHIITISFHTKV